MENNYEDKILEAINETHNKTNGKCGIKSIEIASKLGVTFLDIRDSLNDLNDKKAFKIRKGINNILLFKA
jgi:hypothetical protein